MSNKKPEITIKELQILSALRNQYTNLKRDLELVEASLRESDNTVIAKLDAGATAPDRFVVTVKKIERRYPCWKEHFLVFVKDGKKVADKILAETKPTVTRSVLVKGVAAMKKAA